MNTYSRRDFMRNASLTAAGLLTLPLMNSCSKGPESLDVIVGRDVQAVSKDSADYGEISWAMIPGGNLESLSNPLKYYMQVSSKNGLSPKKPMTTIITSGNLALLMISVYENETRNNVTYHLDTDGYTDYLTFADAQKNGMDIYFSFEGQDTDYHAKLPAPRDILQQPRRLELDVRQNLKLVGYEAVSKEFLIPGKVPAIARIQGNEKTIYVLHRKK